MKEKYKVIEISEAENGYLVAVIVTNEKRVQIDRKLFVFHKKEDVENLIKVELWYVRYVVKTRKRDYRSFISEKKKGYWCARNVERKKGLEEV